MNSINVFIYLLALANLRLTNAERILAIFPIKSRSHHSICNTIVAGLLARGHQVTTLTVFPKQSPPTNQTYIDISDGLMNFVDTLDVESKEMEGVWGALSLTDTLESTACEKILSNTYIKETVESGRKRFDLLFVETYHIHCFIPLAITLNIPIVNIVCPISHFGLEYITGSPNNPSYIPNLLTGVTTHMTFWQRLQNTYYYAILYYYQWRYFDEKGIRIFHNIYGGNVENTRHNYYQKLSLSFNYGHPLLIPRPNVPNVVEVGGLHIQTENPLPKDIKQFIEEAKDGVVFFSFGSTLKASSLPQEKRRIFAKVFAMLPQRVLWRSDDINLTEVSENVKFGKWFPQRDILAHKNVRAFISHGGLLGTYEAIYTGKPVIGIPFGYDQLMNTYILQSLGSCISLKYDELTVDNLYGSINQVLNKQSYSKSAENLSKIFRDRPMSPLDTAVYWLEYVMRHNGAPHLRSVAADTPLYQYLLLDVILFVGIVFSFSLFAVLRFTRLVRYWYRNNYIIRYRSQVKVD